MSEIKALHHCCTYRRVWGQQPPFRCPLAMGFVLREPAVGSCSGILQPVPPPPVPLGSLLGFCAHLCSCGREASPQPLVLLHSRARLGAQGDVVQGFGFGAGGLQLHPCMQSSPLRHVPARGGQPEQERNLRFVLIQTVQLLLVVVAPNLEREAISFFCCPIKI